LSGIAYSYRLDLRALPLGQLSARSTFSAHVIYFSLFGPGIK